MTLSENNLIDKLDDTMILVVDIYKYNWMKQSDSWEEVETKEGYYLIPKNKGQENAVREAFKTETPIKVYSQGEVRLSQIANI